MKRFVALAGLVIGLTTLASGAAAEAALIAVATNFSDTASVLSARFEQQTGHTVVLSSASTGALYAQITRGAPFDAFLSADAKTPARLEAVGLGIAGTRFLYATGRLVLWSADSERIGTDGRDALVDPSVRHIAIANPRLAPYGAAARQALERLALWSALEPRIVVGQNVGHTEAMIASGAAELGFVAAAALLADEKASTGSRWDVPLDLHDPIHQEAILLRHGRDNEAARAFMVFLETEPARRIIRARGYRIDTSPARDR